MHIVEVLVYLDENLYDTVFIGTFPQYQDAEDCAACETVSFYPTEFVHTVGVVKNATLVGKTLLTPIYYGVARPRMYS